MESLSKDSMEKIIPYHNADIRSVKGGYIVNINGIEEIHLTIEDVLEAVRKGMTTPYGDYVTPQQLNG